MENKRLIAPILSLFSALSLAMAFFLIALVVRGDNEVLRAGINNPTPAVDDVFGTAVAALGNDRALIGAEGAGEAYLYSIDGALLKTFSVSDPAAGSFGGTLAALGNDRVIIGAYNYTMGVHLTQVGRAYLFATNGSLLAVFTNPAPASVQALGFSVAAVGSDLVLIGTGGGGPFLFRTNGALVTTFKKPSSGTFDNYGTSIGALGTDRVIIGSADDNTGAAGAGAAFLFGTNGLLLTTFTNPAPAADDNFGSSVAAVGANRLLISSTDYGQTKGTGGAAYLFATNGALITIFTNPAPAAGDYFGWSVASVGSDRVLIGAYHDGTEAIGAGSSYLFGTNGILLATFTNPLPTPQSWFGYSVSALGANGVLIGAVWDNTGSTHAGSAYVYDLPFPPLNISRNSAGLSLSWLTPETGLILQQAGLLDPALWIETTNAISLDGLTNTMQASLDDQIPSRFYRLHRQ